MKKNMSKKNLNELTKSEMSGLLGGKEKVVRIGIILNGKLIIVTL